MTAAAPAKHSGALDLEICCSDGHPLGITVYGGPGGGTRARVAVMVCAMGVRQERYAAFATFLADCGWIVVTFDYRGIGRSATCAASECEASLFEWAEKDLATVIEWANSRWMPSRLVAIGHSIGGQILALAPNHSLLDAAVMIASQKGFTKYWEMPWRLAVWLYWHALPLLVRRFGRLPTAMLGCEDLPKRVALDWQRWALHPEFVDENGQSMSPAYSVFTTPILSISFSDDHLYAPPRAVRALLKLYPNAPSEQWEVEPAHVGLKRLGHSGFFHEAACQGLWERMTEWMEFA